ncbi:MAG: gamma carbonic anhydrase family protein [Pseudomonadota bacterium]|nr:gamma carbonic anhydrase family protein [Pseudomonadota bacterium]
MTLYRIDAKTPQVAASAYIAAEATLIGAVTVGESVSILAGVVARADNEPIVIGNESNVQEGAVLHADPGFPLTIGARVTVGHQAMLHGCTIGDGALIGIQAVVMNGAVIGRSCLVGAGAVVTEGKSFPERSLILGAPAKVVRSLSDADVAGLERAASGYVERGAHFRAHLERVG